MRNSSLLKEWFQKADEDLLVARRAIQGRRKVSWAACYHAQQSAEKHLKGYLVSQNAVPRKIHDLVELLRDCETLDPQFNFIESYCRFLLPFGVHPRYPDEMKITLATAKKAIKSAEQIKDFVLEKIT